jgi:hypothetical protein
MKPGMTINAISVASNIEKLKRGRSLRVKNNSFKKCQAVHTKTQSVADTLTHGLSLYYDPGRVMSLKQIPSAESYYNPRIECTLHSDSWLARQQQVWFIFHHQVSKADLDDDN